ncbi:tRNA lysidine(34) synthetase TilS [Actinomadura hibisca]|uniref:tRNA lysidine(34) synthetase TilS n=1 Tax=Actinomadura hibisca TaxID=68565 RepID=UPI0008299E57|nr:tRNA lysidine(34) synthetase TilS [Actinomadura hibisca]
MGPDPAVAAVRLAVRRVLAGSPPGAMVLAAVSGGADSLALAGALAFEAPRSGRSAEGTSGDPAGGRPAGAVTIDHGLQEGSAERADAVVRVLAGLGLDPVGSIAVTVGESGGPENAARQARYAALDEAAVRLGAAVVLLGHTRDDQAETVLLGLARGSGARSLAGMPATFTRHLPGSEVISLEDHEALDPTDAVEVADPVKVHYARPLLELDRATTRRACLVMGLDPWDDPHNDDPAYTRVRVRHEALPVLEHTLGPGVKEALARTARLLRDDSDALEMYAARAYRDAEIPPDAAEGHVIPPASSPSGPTVESATSTEAASTGTTGAQSGADAAPTALVALRIAALADLPRAVRTRVLRTAAIRAGSPPGTLAAVHVDAVERLVTAWRGQRHVDLPGGLRAFRRYEKLLFGPADPGS